ncbi:unnamed protein product [Discula destructiva]
MSEDQQLLDQISHLAGQINRAKNQHAGIAPTLPVTYGPSLAPAYVRGRGRGRGGGGHHRGNPASGGYRIAKPPVHRHKTLVLNGATAPNSSEADAAAGASGSTNSLSWVTKNDRHLQLINTNIYQEHADARTKAIEQTRLQHLRHKEHRERKRLMNHLASSGYSSAASTDPHSSAPVYEIVVDGIKFAVVKGGSKLVKLPGDTNAMKQTPKVAIIGGVKFYRTKSGNMYRQAVVKAQRKSSAVKKVNAPCSKFSTTGSCPKGPACRHMHDYAKVAACKSFLLKGNCVYGDQCNLSHDLIAERTPHCVHHAKGNCSKPDCPYTHRVLSPVALVCRDFSYYGYCDRGISCPDRHSFECPDFSNTGICENPGCKLPHREYANILRKAAAAREQAIIEDDNSQDLSSDDESDSVGSNEVDSDDVDEFISEDGSLGFTEKDFISF